MRSAPFVLLEDAHVAVTYKPAGVALQRGARDAGGPQRCGPPLGDWAARGGVKASTEVDALRPPRPVSPLHRAVGGIVPLAKTRRAEALLLRDVGLTECIYTAVLAGPTALDDDVWQGRVSLLQSSDAATHGRLMLVRLQADAGTPAAQLCEQLAAAHMPVVGDSTPAPGGLHLALTHLSLPASLAELRGTDASCCFDIDAPKKLEKTMTRERLHAQRRAGANREDAASDADARVTFMGLPLLLGRSQLRPRPSSACIVDAAVAAAAQHATPRLLDLGCGCGALMLAALSQLPPSASAVGVDIDAAALDVAGLNARAVLGARADADVRLLCADFGALHTPAIRSALPAGGFHAMLCNPPYLREAAAAGRNTDEAARALYAGADGLDAYARLATSLAAATPPLLAPGGLLALQLPASAAALRAVQALFERAGFRVGDVRPDDRGVPRCMLITVAG